MKTRLRTLWYAVRFGVKSSLLYWRHFGLRYRNLSPPHPDSLRVRIQKRGD